MAVFIAIVILSLTAMVAQIAFLSYPFGDDTTNTTGEKAETLQDSTDHLVKELDTDETVECPHCNIKNKAAFRYCRHCTSRLGSSD